MIRRLGHAAAVAAVSAAALAGCLPTPAPASPTPNMTPVLAFARAQVGKPYVWGANGPSSWDCSSLIQAAYRTIGVELPRITSEQVGAGEWEPRSQIQPGDLLFIDGADNPHPGHVGMYVGDGQVIEGKGARWGVVVTPLASWHPQAVIRPTAGPGINSVIVKASADTGVPVALLRAQLWQESGLNPHARSGVGAMGIAQFMPTTWPSWGKGGDPYDPADAIPAQARMMAALIKANGGDVNRALAAYNAGQGWVNRYGGVPPVSFAHGQTYNYVRNITADSGISGHIDLHVKPAPIPQRIQHEATRQVRNAVRPPTVPHTPKGAAHDLSNLILLAVLGFAAAWLLLPALYRTLLSASTAPAAPRSRSDAVRVAVAARGARRIEQIQRRAEGTAAPRRTRVAEVPQPRSRRTATPAAATARRTARRRLPDGWTPPQRNRRPQRTPQPGTATTGLHGAVRPAGSHRTAHRIWDATAGLAARLRNRTAPHAEAAPHEDRTAPNTANPQPNPAPHAAADPAANRPQQDPAAPHGAGTATGPQPHPAAAGPHRTATPHLPLCGCGACRTAPQAGPHRTPQNNPAPHAAPQPTATTAPRWTATEMRPATAPQPRTPHPAPHAATAPHPFAATAHRTPQPRTATVPAPQGVRMPSEARVVLGDFNPYQHLQQTGIVRPDHLARAIEETDFGDANQVVAVLLYMDLLTTALAEAGDQIRIEVARRRLAPTVGQALGAAANDVGAGADGYRRAARRLTTEHPDFFETDMSKPRNAIGATAF
jgi:hypothetical protein